MSLKKYIEKRDFLKTPEPKNHSKLNKKNIKKIQLSSETKKKSHPLELKKSTKEFSHIYVIHKHNASHLHYDLRLEFDGVLKSWAIPKTPPKLKELKRLAVEVEDHPLSYANFEGIIPEGNYGAGKVEIWDKGHFKLLERYDDLIVIDIDGEKLHGEYCLVRTKFQGKKNNWIFFRK